jgi:hypothetical protein
MRLLLHRQGTFLFYSSVSLDTRLDGWCDKIEVYKASRSDSGSKWVLHILLAGHQTRNRGICLICTLDVFRSTKKTPKGKVVVLPHALRSSLLNAMHTIHLYRC